MTTIRTLFMAMLVAVAVVAAGGSSDAFAQRRGAPVILFIDEAKLLATSEAGKSISEQMQALAEDAEKTVMAQGARIQNEGQRLEDARDTLSKEDFAKRYQALLAQAQQVGQLEQIKKAELAQARAQALVELNEELQPIIKDILDDKNATVLLERTAVVFADDDMDITEEIVRALDRRLKRVEVQRVDLIAQAQAAQAAQQN